MDGATGVKMISFGLTMILTVFLNGIVLVTFHVDKRRKMSTKCIHIFITNLAVCQLLIGLIVMPFVQVSILYDGWKNDRILCQMNGFSTSVCFYTSVLMLCVISLDRYVAIVMATKYQKLLTRKKGIIIVTLIWSLSSMLSLPPLIGWSTYQYHPGTYHCSPLWLHECGYFYFTFAISVIIPTSFTVFSYSVIFWKVRKHRKRISLWKHGKTSVNASNVNEGQESLTQIEMSQIATVHPETRITASKTPTLGNSPIYDRKTMFLASDINAKNHLTTQENVKQNTNDSMVTSDNIRPKENDLSADTAKQESMNHVDDEKRQGNDRANTIKAKSMILKSHQVFYQPISNAPLNKTQEVRNIAVRELKATDTNDDSNTQNDSYHAQSSYNVSSNNISNGDNAVVERENTSLGETANKRNIISKERKSSRNRSNQDFQHVRLSEEDEHELLNISDTRNNEASSSSRDSTTTGVTEYATTHSVATTETAEDIKKINEKTDEDKIRVVIHSLNSRKINTKTHSKRISKRSRSSHTLREFKVAKTGAILLSFFMMCFGPYTIVHLCHLPYNVPIWAQHIAMWCVFFNSILSPLIYGFMQKETRRKVRDILCKCLR